MKVRIVDTGDKAWFKDNGYKVGDVVNVTVSGVSGTYYNIEGHPYDDWFRYRFEEVVEKYLPDELFEI